MAAATAVFLSVCAINILFLLAGDNPLSVASGIFGIKHA